MNDFDPQDLEQQLQQLMARLAQPDIPRNPRGYQGAIRPGRVILACVFVGEDGLEYVEDPTEFAAAGDLFLRQYVTVGRRTGAGFGETLTKLVPLLSAVAGGAAGPSGAIAVDLLKALFAKRAS